MVQVKKDNTDNSDIPSFVVLMSEMIYSRHVILFSVLKMNIPPGDMPPSRCSTRVDMRLEVDEIETIIREKCRHNSTEIQKRFRDNDPQGIGNITR